MRDFLRQFMLYSRSERRAVIALAILIIIIILIPGTYRFYFAKPPMSYIDTSMSKEILAFRKDISADSSNGSNVSANSGSDSSKVNKPNVHLFYFDPNTIALADWQRLGLSEKQAAVIEKYKAKGGKFVNPADLRKIYVLSDEMKDKLIPYVRIASLHSNSSIVEKGSYRIEINTADSAAFEALYGIGPALSSRIIKFRKLLGGFYKIEQVGETYGVSDSTFQLIKPHLTVNPALVNRIDINSIDYESLRKHPYIHAKIAHAIIGYRNTNGKFENLDQLKKLKPITDEIFNKISPYLIAK